MRGLFVAMLVACGPTPGTPCAFSDPNDMACRGSEAVFCFCDQFSEDGETCLDDAGTWEVDRACSCSAGGGVTCS